MKQGNNVTYLHGDHLGSTSVTSGANISTQTYYAYGAVRTTSGTLPTDYAFTGQKADASDGLMYYGARYYDAALGRFIQPDSIVPNPYNPQALNRYSYVYNNPLRYTDPTGRCPLCISTAIGIVVDVGIDFAIAKLTGSSFSPVESLAVNAGINIATAGIGGKVAKLRHLGKLAGLAESGIRHGDDLVKAAGKLPGVHPGRLGSEVIDEGIEKVAKEWTEDALREIAQKSIQNTGQKKVFALGRFKVDPGLKNYTEIAEDEGFAYFQIPEEYAGLSDGLKKQVNLFTLEIAHNLGYEFKVVTDYGRDWATSGLGDELRYLNNRFGIDLIPE